MKCREIVELIRTGKLTVTETAASPASVAKPLKDDLIKYRVILKAIARGHFDGYKIRFVCDKNRHSGEMRGCACCENWFAPSARGFGDALEPDNCGICIARRKTEFEAKGQGHLTFDSKKGERK